MSSPYKGEGSRIAILNLLKTLSQSIAPSVADMWELEILLLVKYLEGEMSRVHVSATPKCTRRVLDPWLSKGARVRV